MAVVADHDERAVLIEQLATFAAAAEEQCQRLELQLDAARSMASMLRREASRARRPLRSRR